ncbi:MaoC family dehydratase [Lutimaribacter marinistellae]|uniref:MaoC family dehydratase n=1 Tax=Lutimaribacter marinistellae TaxID=1820329 RepID=A0ABV7TLP8_9RHOB
MGHIDAALEQERAKIGTEVGVSNWILVDQTMIDEFARVTLDHQWIHVDPERAARETPFGGTIAHGFLTLSLASRFIYDVFDPFEGQEMGLNYGCNRLRFLAPVPAGSRVRGRFVLKDVQKRSASKLLRTHELTVEIEGQETPALMADWLGMTIFAN